jgi:glycerophosphoryl diester phosphodiesterase
MFVLTALAGQANGRVLVHGHRGARAVLPEGTLPAFKHAIKAGADVLELDLSVTKDNVLVVSHDPVLRADLCKGPSSKAVIRKLTLAEVKQYDCGSLKHPDYPRQEQSPGAKIPTLEEVFALGAGNGVEFNIETKIFARSPELTPSPAEFARLVVAEIRKHKLQSRVMVQSFDFRTLHEVKKLAPEIRLSALYEGPAKDFTAK